MTTPPAPTSDPTGSGDVSQSIFKRWTSGRPNAWLRIHPLAADALLVAPFLVLGLAASFGSPMSMNGVETRPYDALGRLLVLAVTIPLVWRRRAPRLVLAVNLVAVVPLILLNYSDSVSALMALLALYTVAAHCDRRPALLALGWTALLMIPVLMATSVHYNDQAAVASLVSNVIIFGTGWLIGDSVRSRRLLLEQMQLRAETAERQRDSDARQAVLDERARIAREMHDIVAHGMSVMIVQAAAARRVMDKQPAMAAEAMEHIERTGREAMVEMRRLLGVLREEPTETAAPGGLAPLTPQPGLATVPALIEQWNTAGLAVDYELVGDAPDLAPGLDVSAYRVIQEALTNSSKHAGPAHARVTVQVDDHVLDIRVVDDGYGAAATPGPGSGNGLIGMRERVAMFGGSLTAEPHTGGGFVVHAVLPLDAGAVPPTVQASTCEQ